MMDLQEKRDAGCVKRYHTVRLIGEQTVAQHTFNMLLIVLEIEPNPSLNLVKAVMYHDLPELATGDIPATFKWSNKTLAHILEIAEQTFLEVAGLNVELTEYEERLLKFADMMELVLFCREQITMGNAFCDEIIDRGIEYLRSMPEFSPKATALLNQTVTDLYGVNDD